jgi:signal transduction histidine kinase
MREGGRLLIETGNVMLESSAAAHGDLPPGPYVMLTVTDSGTGIAAEILPKVFEPFFTTKEPEAGTGLGLSMVHAFVKQSRGHVVIDSKVGRGTSVKIYLPRSDSLCPAKGGDEERPMPHRSTRNLVIEEDGQVHGSVVRLR